MSDGLLLDLDYGYLRNFTEGRRAINTIKKITQERNEARAAADKDCLSLAGQLATAQAEVIRLTADRAALVDQLKAKSRLLERILEFWWTKGLGKEARSIFAAINSELSNHPAPTHAALMAQVAGLETDAQGFAPVTTQSDALVAQLEQLTRERNEVRAIAERECCCGDNFQPVSGPHDCVAGSGQAEGGIPMSIERLTIKERDYLSTWGYSGGQKALRIIDALTEALAAAEQSVRDWCKNVREERGRAEAAEARVRELTLEVERESNLRVHWHGCFEQKETELLRLRGTFTACEVARLESECEVLRAPFHETLHDKETELNNLRAEVERRRETSLALNAENAKLAAEVERWKDMVHTLSPQAGIARLKQEAAESRLAAANALPARIWEALGELTSYLVDGDHMVKVDDVRRTFERHLAAQPATAPVRDEADEGCEYPAPTNAV